MKFAFFGSSEFSLYVLNELEKSGIKPDLVVTTPDKPKGRKLTMTPTPVKAWALSKGIETVESMQDLQGRNFDVFLVASYGKIIKPEIFNLPKHKTLNIHPSLLPKYRGASPIVSQVLNDDQEVGVTIMQIDEQMDHGPIVAQKIVEKRQCTGIIQLEEMLAREGARLFADILPGWVEGNIEAKPQDESQATFCTKIKKEDGLLDLNGDPKKNYLKFLAFQGWPSTYFFENDKRVIVTDAALEDNDFKIVKVKPEGKNEMPYSDYLRGKK
jgi:methionyl-tRNA formyltransferase